MGKGNRNRRQNLQNAAEDRYNHPEKYQKKGKKSGIQGKSGAQFPAWAGVLAFVLVAVILLGSISLVVINGSGVILRSKTAIESENYKITGTMMKYYYYFQYQNTYSTYYNYAVSYLGSADYMTYFGWDLDANYAHDDELNNKCTLGTVKTDENGTEMTDDQGNKIYDSRAMELRGGSVYTWWDYFMDLALTQAEEILVFCEAAHAAGYDDLDSLNPDAKDDIDTVIDSLKDSASAAGYSTRGYLNQLYGSGITVKDVRRALELSYIASEYAALVQDELNDGITEDEVNTRYEENATDYQFADAITIDYKLDYDAILESKVSLLGEEYETEEYNEQVEAANKEYAVRLAHLRSIAPRFAEAKGNEELFRDLLKEMYAYEFYFQCYIEDTDKDLVMEDVIAEALEIVDETTEAYETSEEDPLAKRIAKYVYDEEAFFLYEDMTYSDNELGNWAFKALEQANGNVLVVITETDGSETVYAYPELKYSDEEETTEEEATEEEATEEEATEEDSTEEETAEGDEAESEYAGEVYELGAYYMITPASRDEYKAIDLGYILVSAAEHEHEEGEEVDHEDIDPKFQAEDYLTQFVAGGDLTAEAFEDFAFEQGIAEYNVVENYLKGDFGYDEMDEWAFGGESRVGTGSVVAIYGENDDPIYYAVAFCFAEGDPAWYADAKNDILTEKYEEWSEEATNTYTATITTYVSTLESIG